MAFVVAALEVSDKIQTVGAIAGFAAILGLAVLSVLYFGQAREVKRLREWAGRAPERAAEMQDRVSTDAQRRVVAQPLSQPQPRPAAAQPATPGAAATAGAKTAPAPLPAAGAATKTPPAVGAPTVAGRTTPVPGEPKPVAPADGTDQPTVLHPSVAGGAGAAAAASGATAAPPSGTPTPGQASATPAAPASDAKPSGTPAAPAAATATPAATPPKPAPASTPPKPPASPPATAAGGRAPAPASRPEPAVPLRSARTSREATATSPAPSSGPTGATIAIVAAVAAIVIAVVLVVTGVIGGGDEPNKARNVIVPTAPEPGTPTTGTTDGGTTALNRAGVSVVVLNGTPTANLAREAADKLGRDGYQLAAAGNRGDATVAKTLVLYADGQVRAARDIVKLLKLGSVGRLDAGTEVVAQTHVKPTGAKPDVVVTLGADAAQP